MAAGQTAVPSVAAGRTAGVLTTLAEADISGRANRRPEGRHRAGICDHRKQDESSSPVQPSSPMLTQERKCHAQA